MCQRCHNALFERFFLPNFPPSRLYGPCLPPAKGLYSTAKYESSL